MNKLPFLLPPPPFPGTTFKLARGDKAVKIELVGTTKLCIWVGSKTSHRSSQAMESRNSNMERRWQRITRTKLEDY